MCTGQARTLKAKLEHRIGTRVPPDARIPCWLVEFAAYVLNSCDIGSDGKTPLHRLHGRKDNTPILELGEKILYIGGKWEPRFHPGVFVAMLNWLSEAVVATEQGTAIKTRAANVRRISERWDANRVLGIRAVPWSPDGSDNAFDIQVGMESSVEMGRLLSGEVLMVNKVARTYFRRADFERCGLSEGCLGCRSLGTGQGRHQAHSEACRRRIDSLWKGDSAGSARLAAADERINRALADAVERFATKDPGVRGTLTFASVVCHPEWEPLKKIAVDTGQDSTPHHSVSFGGSSASGALPSTTTSTDQNIGASDATREVRAGPARDVNRPCSEDHNGGDVAMRGNGANQNSG